ncbi:MAG: YraN family protein, partial [Candidatus Puniceispirillaceae bacterium]
MGRRPTADYQAAEEAGRRAEYLTRFLYHLAGYRCVTMRQKTPFGELDLIMHRSQKILILAVKFRQRMDNFNGGLPDHQQIKRMRNAILWVSFRYPVFTERICILRVV